MTQPWDFILVRDVATRRRFQSHVQQERAVFTAALDPERTRAFADVTIEGIMEASPGIVVTYDPERGSPAVLGRHAIADAGPYSTCLAIHHDRFSPAPSQPIPTRSDLGVNGLIAEGGLVGV